MSAPHSDVVFAVEDDLDTQANLRDILSLDDYELEVVSTIGAALRRQDLNRFFAFILDRQLPDGSADDLLPHIRKAAPSAGILIITGHADLRGTITALRHGVDDYILKPIDADALRGSLIRIHNLREARNRLIQAERLAAIGQMVSGIAHESRNFLQKISASVETLQSLPCHENPEVAAELSIIARSCDGLTCLLDDLREYAAPIQLDRSRRDLTAIWRAAWTSATSAHPESEASLIEELATRNCWCSVDGFRMEQVFRNLFENAIAAGSKPARVKVSSTNGFGASLRITVSDNGSGLKVSPPSRVFEPFFTTKTRGTGLGLSIVRRILEAHGGTIAARNLPEKGAAFDLEIPMAFEEVAESTSTRKP
ncbi:MAG TPA: ATP-binding protein [Planctomycetaceae bacterium]|nr:ATP-binding protein [Planctomycetaceae bacterium]